MTGAALARSPDARVDAATSIRTCVGCRVRAPRSDLLRVVAVEGACVPDLQFRLPGRGAHLHPRLECLDLADRRRAWSRALRRSSGLDSGPVRDHLARLGITNETAAPSGSRSTRDEHSMSTARR